MNPYVFLAIGLVVGIAVGSGIGYFVMANPSSLQEEISSLQSQVTSLQAQNNDLADRNQALSGNISDLRDSYDLLQANYAGLSVVYADLQINYTELSDILNLQKEIMLEENRTIAFGSMPVTQLSYNLSYPGYLQVNLSADQFGGVFECVIMNGSLVDVEDVQEMFNFTGGTFELSGTVYIYMGTGPFTKTLTMPVLPGNNTVLLIYAGDSVPSTTMALSIKYVY